MNSTITAFDPYSSTSKKRVNTNAAVYRGVPKGYYVSTTELLFVLDRVYLITTYIRNGLNPCTPPRAVAFPLGSDYFIYAD